MSVQPAARNLAGSGVKAGVTHLSLHTTDGSTTGSGELTGGAYARKVPTYGTVTDGDCDLSSSVVFDGPGSSSVVTHVGFWNSTTWLGSAALSASKTIGPGDTLTITSAPIVVS